MAVVLPSLEFEKFREDGIVFAPAAVRRDDLQAFQRRIAEIVWARHKSYVGETTQLTVPETPFGPVDASLLDAMLLELRERSPKHQSFVYDVVRTMPELWRLVTCDSITELVRRCFGLQHSRSVGISDTQLRIDGPRDVWDETLPWHQDYPYIPLVTEQCTLVIWIAVFDCSTELGPPQLLTGTHRWGALEHVEVPSANGRRLVHKIPPAYETRADQIPPTVGEFRAGDAVVFDICTVHRSGVNATKSRIRWTATCRYNDVLARAYLPKYSP
ncbi:MAG: phytanoyl-CoA dioxygenase family protein [Thermoanaerobaculia bacterium]